MHLGHTHPMALSSRVCVPPLPLGRADVDHYQQSQQLHSAPGAPTSPFNVSRMQRLTTIGACRYADPSSKQPELVQQADGLFVRRLPAALLREMNIVDTPGTNVILERQQRLTEEYVPRADLVLFVLSADRPLSESELAFLKYIRQWRKKVVFVVNKVSFVCCLPPVHCWLS